MHLPRELLSAVVDTAACLICVDDADGRLIVFNRACEELTGFTFEEIRELGTASLVPPEELPAVKAVCQAHRSGEQPVRHENHWICKNGARRLISWTNTVVTEGEAVAFIVATGIDVTEARRAEEALRGNEERTRRILEAALDAVIGMDASGRVVFWSSQAAAIFGWTETEAIGAQLAELIIPPDERKAYRHGLRHYLETGEGPILGQRVEVTAVDRAGRLFPVELDIAAVRAAEGLMFTAFVRDITDRKQAEARLRESEERFRAMADSAPVQMWMSDAAGEPLFFNRGWHEFTGLTLDDEIRAGGWVGVHEDDVDDARVVYKQSLEKRSPYETEYRVRRADGQYRHIRDRAVPRFVPDGTFAGFTGVGVDVTDQRNAERVVQESEERLRHLFEITPAMIWMTDADGGLRFLSRAGLDFTGRTLEEELGRGWEDVTHPDDLPLVYEAYELARDGRENSEITYRLRRHDGEWRWVLERANPNFDSEGRFVGLTGTTFDVTEQRKAEQALKASEERLRHVFEITPAMIWMTDPAGMVSFFSRSGLEFHGRSMEEWQGRGWELDVHPDDLPRVLEMYDGAVAARTGYEAEYRIRRHDGQYRWVFERGSPHYDPGGRFAGLTGATLDITERREMQEALRESEERFRQLAENVEDVFWLADRRGTPVVYLSPAFDRVWGRPRGDFLANPDLFAECMHPDDRADQLGRVAHLAQDEFDVQYRIVRPDGSIRWIRDRSFHVHDENGEVVRVAGIAIDITENKQANEERQALEEQVRHAQKLESLGVLAGGIAHDFNNLLMGVLGNAGLALAELSPQSAAHETVARIETAALRAAELTNQMLAYAGRGRFVVAPIDVSRLVDEMAHLLSSAISKKATLRYELASNLPSVEGDATQLRQVVMNLITNASDALGDESGVIAVRTGVMDADRRQLADALGGEALARGALCLRRGRRHRCRHGRGDGGTDLRPLLHDQVHRSRSRSRRNARDRSRSRWSDRGRERAGRRNDGPSRSSAGRALSRTRAGGAPGWGSVSSSERHHPHRRRRGGGTRRG